MFRLLAIDRVDGLQLALKGLGLRERQLQALSPKRVQDLGNRPKREGTRFSKA